MEHSDRHIEMRHSQNTEAHAKLGHEMHTESTGLWKKFMMSMTMTMDMDHTGRAGQDEAKLWKEVFVESFSFHSFYQSQSSYIRRLARPY